MKGFTMYSIQVYNSSSRMIYKSQPIGLDDLKMIQDVYSDNRKYWYLVFQAKGA
jgi:hypothetical protein